MKKLICLVLAVMLALSAVSAFAAEYTDKETVKKVQQALNDAGFDCGTPDGAAGKKTKAAITDYQNANGLTSTGVIDDELLVSLGLAEAEAAETTEEMPVETKTTEVDAGLPHIDFLGAEFGATLREVKETCEQAISPVEASDYDYITIDEIRTMPQDHVFYLHTQSDWKNVTDSFLVAYLGLDEVANHNTVGSYMMFVRPIENGNINTNEDESIFYAGLYQFQADKGVKEDLIAKLEELYGDSTKQGDFIVWKGEGNVEITLYDEMPKYSYPFLSLAYVWLDAETMIEDAFELPSDNANTESSASGL